MNIKLDENMPTAMRRQFLKLFDKTAESEAGIMEIINNPEAFQALQAKAISGDDLIREAKRKAAPDIKAFREVVKADARRSAWIGK